MDDLVSGNTSRRHRHRITHFSFPHVSKEVLKRLVELSDRQEAEGTAERSRLLVLGVLLRKLRKIGAASDAVFQALEKCNRRRRRAAVHSDLEENMPRIRRFAAPLEKLDNMKSSGRFHDIGNLVFLQRKDGFFKILDELPPAPGAEIATRRGRCRVLGVPAR